MRAWILLMVFCSTSPLHATEDTKVNKRTDNQNREIIRRLFEDCFNSGKLGTLDAFIDPDYAGAGGQKGVAAFAAPIANLLRAFPDIHYTIEDLVAEDDRVAVKWTWSGTHTGDFSGIAATQKSVSNEG